MSSMLTDDEEFYTKVTFIFCVLHINPATTIITSGWDWWLAPLSSLLEVSVILY